jgi:ribosomal protein L37AE/L43A
VLRSAALGLVWREEYEMSETYVQVEYGTHVRWKCEIYKRSSMMEELKDGVWPLMSCGWNQGSGSFKSGFASQAIACVEERLKRKPRNTWARYFMYTACLLIYQDEMVLGMSLS